MCESAICYYIFNGHLPLLPLYHLLLPKAKGGSGKKPLTGFMLFSKEHREKVKADQPDLSFGQIGKKLGEMWRELTDDEKTAYKSGGKSKTKE